MKNEIKVIGIMPIKGMDVIKRIYSGGGCAPTLNTMQGGLREPKVTLRRVNETKTDIRTSNSTLAQDS